MYFLLISMVSDCLCLQYELVSEFHEVVCDTEQGIRWEERESGHTENPNLGTTGLHSLEKKQTIYMACPKYERLKILQGLKISYGSSCSHLESYHGMPSFLNYLGWLIRKTFCHSATRFHLCLSADNLKFSSCCSHSPRPMCLENGELCWQPSISTLS